MTDAILTYAKFNISKQLQNDISYEVVLYKRSSECFSKFVKLYLPCMQYNLILTNVLISKTDTVAAWCSIE